MSKVKKTQGDFRKRATESQVEEEREIYNTFIKKYDVVKRVLVGCIIIIPIISFFIIKILLP